jgi:hypothetical protein
VILWLGVLGALAAWLGAALLVLSEGRLAVATGILSVGAGIGGVALAARDPGAAAFIAGGGLLAAVLRARERGALDGWAIMPPGSSPRIILTLVAGAAALWLGASYLNGPGDRLVAVAVLAVIGLAGARLLESESRSVLLGTASALALAFGGAAVFVAAPAVPAAAVAAVAATVLGFIRAREAEPRGA